MAERYGQARGTLIVAAACLGAAATIGCGGGGAKAAPTSTTSLAAQGTPTITTTPAGREAADGRCQPDYLVHAPDTHGTGEIADARDGRFKIGNEKVKLVPPVDWALDPHSSRRFRGALSSLAWLDVLFYAYQQGDRGAVRQATDLVGDWVRQNPRRAGATDRTWDDRITATRATYMAYDLKAARCQGMLGKKRIQALHDSLLDHAERMTNPAAYRPTNHGLFVDTNLILFARALPRLSHGADWEALGKRRFASTLNGRTIRQDGFWLEHSASYQLAVREEVEYFLGLVGGSHQSLTELFERMTDVAGWLVEPDGKLVLLGSSNVRPVETEVTDAAADDDGMLWLQRSGLAVIKRPGAFLSLAATFFNGSHKHSDDLSFDLYDTGRRILTDSGLYDKDPGPWSRFGASAQAHTTLTVDGKRFSQNPDRAYGSGLSARGEGDGWFALLGRNPLIRRAGVEHQRLLLYQPGLGVLIADRVRSNDRHIYRRYFQISSGIDATASDDGVDLAAPGWTGRLEAGDGLDADFDVAKGQRPPRRILGFEFPTFRERVPRPTAVMTTRGRDLDHLAVLSVDGGHPLGAELLSASGDSTRIALEVDGAPAGTLTVTRDSRHLAVSVTP